MQSIFPASSNGPYPTGMKSVSPSEMGSPHTVPFPPTHVTKRKLSCSKDAAPSTL